MLFKIKKHIAFFLLFFAIGGFVVGAMPQPAKAQWATIDIPSIGTWIWEKLQVVYVKMDKQMMATAFKNSLSTFLNKMAYDSAVYVASAGSGQKGLVNPFSKEALTNLADSVAGGFIDELATKSGFADALGTSSLCEPADLTMKANLLLSFKKPKEPPLPKCSLTKMKQAAQKSAQDNLLEFNAGFEESEGGLNIILSGVNAEQNFAGTNAQKELSRISDDLATLLPDLQNIMKTIQNALQVDRNNTTVDDVRSLHTDTSAQAIADGQLDMLHSIEDKLGEYDGTLFTLQENAGKCLAEYSQNGSVCGNGVATTGEQCDIKNKFCSSLCKINGGATNDCANPPDKQCGTPNSSPSADGMTCVGLGFAPGTGGTVDCDNNCHYKPNCFPTATAECNNAELMPSCADFYTAASLTMCNNNASFAIQYVGTILGTVSSYLTQVQEWNKKIENKELKTVQANDPADIAKSFNPEANEMGQFGKIQETLSQKTQEQLEHEKLKTLAEGPCKGVTKPITGEVVTPSAATCAAINEALAKSTKGQETFTGTVADAFGIFANTLTSKLMERYFKKGLSVIFDAKGLKECKGPDGKDCISKDKTEDLLKGGTSLGGKAVAEAAFGGLLTASIETGGQQDILSILSVCPPEQPALNNCIIDEPFRRAIEKQLTVKEAIDAYKTSGGSEGLDPKKPFGYILVGTSSMDEPDFKNGYPYRSMLYLRKYRIIPVGWELAAQYIKNATTLNTYTLEEVEDGFDNSASPFFGLVDPAWVLKSPTVFCARQGPGPELLSSEMQCEKYSISSTAQCIGDEYQSRKVSRKEWCADEQTCLEEGENGDCKRYGYCTLEKPFWKLGGTQCEKNYASCEGYTNYITKANYTVLENTLNASDCNASNVGCQWYCQEAPKMCIGGTRGGQPCGTNNDCASIYCSVGTCSSGAACSYDNDCGTGNTCKTNARKCVNGDRHGEDCTPIPLNPLKPLICGQGVVDGVCEEGGMWSCLNTDKGTCSNNGMSCTKLTENTVCVTGSVTGSCNIPNRINLDRDVKKCEAKNAGCDQFIKVLPGTNLIGNSGFEDDTSETLSLPPGINGLLNQWYIERSGGTVEASINSTMIHSGKNSLKINASGPNISALLMGVSTLPLPTPVGMVVPTGFSLDPDKTYTASAWVYVSGAALPSAVSLGFGNLTLDQWETVPTTQSSPQWERISATVTPERMAQWGRRPNVIKIYLSGGSGDIFIDDLQLEEGLASNYAQYGSLNLAHLNGKRITCEESEIGCKLYSPASGGAGIPGVINEKDKCPAECSGYKQYRELPAFFSPSRGCELDTSVACVDIGQCPGVGNACLNDADRAVFQNLIPSTASSCSASAVGCEEFTNLDTVASGGEAKEYYTRLRQCAKPGTTTEATFYTWEGSEESGFQLRAWRLKANGPRPYTTDGVAGCADLTDPDCRIFYDQTGAIYKEELSSTVFISSDCHPYRKTARGTRAECAGSGGRSDPAGNSADIDYATAVVTCVYDAIPSQGVSCSVQYAGCREYRGPTASNLRTAFSDDFEDLTSQGWQPSYLSAEATTVGGRSYHLHSSGIGDPWTLKKSVADLVEQDKTYVLEFWAKWNTAEDASQNLPGNILVVTRFMNARFFGTATSNISFPLRIDIGNSGEWNRYVIGPVNFSRSPAVDENIEIFPADANGAPCTPERSAGSSSCAGDFYIDNIVLREITDSPYLIKDSWKTPLSCDLDPNSSAQAVDTIDDADGITALEVGSIVLADSAGFAPGPGVVAIDGEAIQYTAVAGATLTGLTRGMRGTTPVAHSDNAEVWLLDEGAQLGCEEYKDSSGQTVYLRSFTNLCREDRVGCTEMINTYNSRSIYPKTDKGEYIQRDRRELVVDNPKLYCDVSLKGCEKMGQPALDQNGAATSWGEAYLINDPDQYDKIACQSNETMCSEFVNSDGGTVYFKDPKDALCEYNSSINIEGTIAKGWFKKGVIPAALGSLVFYDSDGVGGPDSYAHLECMTAAGIWDATKWTYSCPSDQVGCTEFRSFEAVPQSYYSLNKGVDSASCMGVIDPLKGCVAFYDKSNPFKMIDSTIIGGNAFAPACVKCSEPTPNNICSGSATCNPDKDNCCCNNGTVAAAAATLPTRNICNANAILKVKLDRQCAEWLACRTSVEVKDSKGNKLKLCTSRQACTSASNGVECDDLTGWVPNPAGNQTNVADANLRSGFFKAGKTMGAGAIQGYYAYPSMSQVGGLKGSCSIRTTIPCDLDSQCSALSPAGQTCVNRAIVFEDDFETYQSGELLPQCSANATQPGTCVGDDPLTSRDEDTCKPAPANAGICLNYWSKGRCSLNSAMSCAANPDCLPAASNGICTGLAKATNKEFKFGGQSLLVTDLNAGTPGVNAIISKRIPVAVNRTYAISVWLNTKDLKDNPTIGNYLSVNIYKQGIPRTPPTLLALSGVIQQNTGKGWTKYIATFNTGIVGTNEIWISINMRFNNTGSKGYVDMISLAPVLEIQNPFDAKTLPSNYAITADPAYVERSCRIYAKPDALTCNYRERNTGRQIQGLRGFCAEFDPKNPEYCLQWWPIDLISGEDISKF